MQTRSIHRCGDLSIFLRGFSLVVLFWMSSVVVPCSATWLSEALQCERYLSKDLSLQYINVIQTHNSFNARNRGYSMAPNQELTLTQQLQLGVRSIELDIHNISALSPSIRVCHGSSDTHDACEGGGGWTFCQLAGINDYGPSTGCRYDALTLEQTLSEIATWVNKSPGEFLFIWLELEGQFDQAYLGNAFTTAFGSYIYTPQDLANNGGNYPTPQQVVQNDKRVFIGGPEAFNGAVNILEQWPGYPHKKVKFFDSATCSSLSTNAPPPPIPVRWALFYGDESKLLSITDGPSEIGVINDTNSPWLFDCGFSAGFDMISSERMKATIWSWDVSKPTSDTSLNCAAMGPNNRWLDLNCNEVHRYACKSNSNNTIWAISTSSGNWGAALCPSGYSFSVPQLSIENAALKRAKTLGAVDYVWLRFSDASEEGIWRALITDDPNGFLVCNSTGAVDSVDDFVYTSLPLEGSNDDSSGIEDTFGGGSGLAWALLGIFTAGIVIIAACIAALFITMFRR